MEFIAITINFGLKTSMILFVHDFVCSRRIDHALDPPVVCFYDPEKKRPFPYTHLKENIYKYTQDPPDHHHFKNHHLFTYYEH